MTSPDDFYEVPSYPLAPFPSGSMPVKPRFFKAAMESSCPNATAMCCVEISEPWNLHEFDYRQCTSARIVDQSVIFCFLFAVSRTVALKSWKVTIAIRGSVLKKWTWSHGSSVFGSTSRMSRPNVFSLCNIFTSWEASGTIIPVFLSPIIPRAFACKIYQNPNANAAL